jgi:hypothetical protein
MTLDKFDELLATKPLPLLPQPYVRSPGPIGDNLADAIYHDRWSSCHKQERDSRLDLLQRRYGKEEPTPCDS